MKPSCIDLILTEKVRSVKPSQSDKVLENVESRKQSHLSFSMYPILQVIKVLVKYRKNPSINAIKHHYKHNINSR